MLNFPDPEGLGLISCFFPSVPAISTCPRLRVHILLQGNKSRRAEGCLAGLTEAPGIPWPSTYTLNTQSPRGAMGLQLTFQPPGMLPAVNNSGWPWSLLSCLLDPCLVTSPSLSRPGNSERLALSLQDRCLQAR